MPVFTRVDPRNPDHIRWLEEIQAEMDRPITPATELERKTAYSCEWRYQLKKYTDLTDKNWKNSKVFKAKRAAFVDGMIVFENEDGERRSFHPWYIDRLEHYYGAGEKFERVSPAL